jgi:LytS/YehU family sensor histidine kinase
MRDVLDNSAKPKVALDDELGMLEKYIRLEQLRLEEKFEFNIVVSPDLQADFFMIPGMIIQPYVENAIWHGLMHKTEKGYLQLAFERNNGSILCTITDNGVGRDRAAELERPYTKKRKRYGIKLSQKRLELLHQKQIDIPAVIIDDLVDEKAKPAGTRVTIQFHLDNQTL